MAKILSFELTMPNRGSWNGQWSGQNKKYFIIKSLSDRYINSKEHLKVLLAKGNRSFYYGWSDGWGANVNVEIIDSVEARKRRKQSAGFCGYDWMVDSIIFYGRIMTQKEQKEMLIF